MFTRVLRWLIPLLVLAVLAIGLIVIPVVHSHADSVSGSSAPTPNAVWHP